MLLHLHTYIHLLYNIYSIYIYIRCSLALALEEQSRAGTHMYKSKWSPSLDRMLTTDFLLQLGFIHYASECRLRNPDGWKIYLPFSYLQSRSHVGVWSLQSATSTPTCEFKAGRESLEPAWKWPPCMQRWKQVTRGFLSSSNLCPLYQGYLDNIC